MLGCRRSACCAPEPGFEASPILSSSSTSSMPSPSPSCRITSSITPPSRVSSRPPCFLEWYGPSGHRPPTWLTGSTLTGCRFGGCCSRSWSSASSRRLQSQRHSGRPDWPSVPLMPRCRSGATSLPFTPRVMKPSNATSSASSLAVIGGLAQGHLREVLWALVVTLDLFSAAVGFYVPGLGRTATREWNIDGAHAAERIQAFVMIALGESIVIVGASLTGFKDLSLAEIIAYLLAFVTTVTLWWVYFDRSAAFAARALASSPDPGRLARSAFYWAQVPVVAGIIAVAAGDRLLLAQPTQLAGVATASILLGGTAIFLAGHALFKLAIWHHVSRPHIAAIILLLLLIPIGVFLPGLAVAALAIVGLGVVVAALRGQAAVAVIEAIRPATAGD